MAQSGFATVMSTLKASGKGVPKVDGGPMPFLMAFDVDPAACAEADGKQGHRRDDRIGIHVAQCRSHFQAVEVPSIVT